MKYELANGSLCGHAQHPELPAAGNIVESKSSEADKPWRCRFTDGCEAVFRSVKRNPLMSLCIAITTVAAGRAIAGMALNNRTTNMALNNRITNNVNSANSNSGEIEIPPHLLRSTLTKDIFINNTAAASDTSDITNNDHSGAIEGGYSSSDSITTNLPVDQAPKYRAKRQIQASGKFSNSEFSNRDRQRLEITIRATQKDVGCTAHYGPLFDLKKEFSRQEEELKKKLDYHVEANKEVLLNDINKPNGLLSIVEKLEQDVGEFMAEKSAFDPKYHTELKVISLEEYASYFSPTQNITLKELRKVEVGKVKDNAKDARIKAKSMPYCKGKIKKIKRDARDQKTKIRSMVEQASNELDCFLFRKYENDIRPRYQALKTKINDSAQLYSWPIPTQMPELAIPSECTVRPTTDWPTTVRPTTDWPTTVRPTTVRPTTDRPTTVRPTTVRPTTDRPTTDRPTTDRPTTDRPTTDRPTTDRPTTVRPTTDRPTTVRPTTDRPTTARPTTAITCAPLCPLKWKPICGRLDDDLITYPSKCVYEAIMCRYDKPVDIVSSGSCKEV